MITAINLIIKNYSKTPFFLPTWILTGSLFGALMQSKGEMATRLLGVLLFLIIFNSLAAYYIVGDDY